VARFFPILATPTGEVAVGTLTTEPGEQRGLMPPSGASANNASIGNDGL
jgi:hypothetical protein